MTASQSTCPQVVVEERQGGKGDQRADHRPRGVHGAVEPVRLAQRRGRDRVGDEGVARSPSDALAHAVDEPPHQHDRPHPRSGDDHLADGGEGVRSMSRPPSTALLLYCTPRFVTRSCLWSIRYRPPLYTPNSATTAPLLELLSEAKINSRTVTCRRRPSAPARYVGREPRRGQPDREHLRHGGPACLCGVESHRTGQGDRVNARARSHERPELNP